MSGPSIPGSSEAIAVMAALRVGADVRFGDRLLSVSFDRSQNGAPSHHVLSCHCTSATMTATSNACLGSLELSLDL